MNNMPIMAKMLVPHCKTKIKLIYHFNMVHPRDISLREFVANFNKTWQPLKGERFIPVYFDTKNVQFSVLVWDYVGVKRIEYI